MSKMKINWKTKILNEVGKIFSGNSINAKIKKEKYLNINEGIPYIATKDISYAYNIDYENGVKIPEKELKDFRVAHKNSVFICAEGGSAGRKLAFNTKKVCFVNKLFAIETLDFVDSKFIYYFYQATEFQKQFKSQMTGLIGGVSLNKFKQIKIPLPALATQKQIVKILDKTFESISKSKENAEKNLKNAKELFESYLEEIFSNPKEDWEEKKLGEVCKVIAGQSPEGKYYNKEGEGLPFYQGKKEYGLKYIKEPKIWTTKITKEAEKGDILMSVRAPVGPINFSTQKICIGRGLAAIRGRKLIDKEFLFYILSKHEKDIVGNTGAVFNSINKSQIENISFFLPPLSQQTQIVSKLDSLSKEIKELETIYKQKIKDLEELKKSILKKAFSGELTKDIN